MDEPQTAWQLWNKIKDLYDKKSPASQMYWLKQLMDLRMKDNATMTAHLSQFHVILKNLTSQGITFPDEVTPLFLLGTLGESWDVFRTAYCAPATVLKLADVESALLQEEINRKN